MNSNPNTGKNEYSSGIMLSPQVVIKEVKMAGMMVQSKLQLFFVQPTPVTGEHPKPSTPELYGALMSLQEGFSKNPAEDSELLSGCRNALLLEGHHADFPESLPWLSEKKLIRLLTVRGRPSTRQSWRPAHGTSSCTIGLFALFCQTKSRKGNRS